LSQLFPHTGNNCDGSGVHPGDVDPMAALIEHGMLLQSARVRGSWWGHPASAAIFEALNELAASPDVVRLRLVQGKVTLVHRRLWPALVRTADRFPARGLAALHEEHTPSGAHEVHEQPFPGWVPDEVAREAAGLAPADALAQLPECLRTA
jgi:hypothetical protein